jgi:hypothetical protein
MVSFFETYSSPQFIHLLKMFNDQNEFVQNESPRIENVDNETSIIVQTSSAQLDQSKKMAKLIPKEVFQKSLDEVLNFIKE